MLTTTSPADVLRIAAAQLATMRGEVSVVFLAVLITLVTEARDPDPKGRLRADTVRALVAHVGHDSLSTWLPRENPLPACVVAGIMRTAAAALEVAG